jgi:hypothetical protein
MIVPRRFGAALACIFTLMGAAPAAAQGADAPVLVRSFALTDLQPRRPLRSDASEVAMRLPGEARRGGLLRAFEVGERLQVGIGHYLIPEIARPRTHMERDRQPVSVRPRERRMAAIGISVEFD